MSDGEAPRPIVDPKSAFLLPTEQPLVATSPLAGPVAIAERFLTTARKALLDGHRIDTSPEDVLAIVRSWPARKHVLTTIKTNDGELVAEAVEFLAELAKRLERNAKSDDRHATLVERAGLTVAASLTVGGIGALVTLGATLGPIGMLAGGLVGLVLCGSGRHILATRADGGRDAVADIREFASELKVMREMK